MQQQTAKSPLLDYPKQSCGWCHNDTWWHSGLEPGYLGTPGWLCGTCHPPTSEVTRLKMRIMKGNFLLSQRRLEIWQIPKNQAPGAWAKFYEAQDRIKELGKQLKLLDTNCIYLEGSKKIKKCMTSFVEIECFACPNDYWPTMELFDKDKKDHPEVWK